MNCKISNYPINLKLLPMKIHYFMFFAAISTVLPFIPLVAKQLGISATATGLIYTIVPFISMIACPIFGWLSDRLKKLKIIILVLILIQSPCYFLINYIPRKQTEKQSFEFFCTEEQRYILPNNRTNYSKSDSLKDCQCYSLHNNNTFKSYDCLNILSFLLNDENNSFQNFTNSENSTICLSTVNISCICSCYNDSLENTFSTEQFCFLLLLMILSLITTNALISLSDAACYESLNGKLHQYGKQRLWGTVSYGLGAVLTGYIVDLANNPQDDYIDYSSCFYLMLALMICDFIAVTQTELRKTPSSHNIIKNVSFLFKNPKTSLFAFAVFLIGCLSAIQWNYTFWYLKDLGADNLLMGLTITTRCFIAELPCFFFSGWIIKRIGEDNSMCLSFLAFSLWFLVLSFLFNPWWVILVEVSQGPSFGLFYATMTSYAKHNAPIGTEATLQTVLGAAFHGLGIGIGSCLGGIGFDCYGGRTTFMFVGCFSILFAMLYKLGNWILLKRRNEDNPIFKKNNTSNGKSGEEIRNCDP